MKKFNIHVLIQVAVLIALEIVLSRFCSITTPVMKIGFGFVPIAVCGMLFGPIWAGVAGGVSDLIGAVLFPSGPFFPGFTISAILTGVIFGLLLRRDEKGWLRLTIAVVLNCMGISLLLNTYWLSLLWDTPFLVLLPTRIIQFFIIAPIQFIVLRLMRQPVRRYLRREGHI